MAVLLGYLSGLTWPLLGIDRCVEAKVKADGFRQLYGWLEHRDILIVRADRREPLCIVPLRLAVEVAKAAEQSRGEVAS